MKVGDIVTPRYANWIGTVTEVSPDGWTVVVEYPWGPQTHADVALIVLPR